MRLGVPTFLVKMSYIICMRMKNHLHIKGLALNIRFDTEAGGNSEIAYA